MDYVNPWHRKWHRNLILETIRFQRKPRTESEGALLLPRRPRDAKASSIWNTDTPTLFAVA